MSEQPKHSAKKYKVCFLGYTRLTALAQEVIQELPPSDVEYILLECSLELQEKRVAEARQLGCEVFIAGPGNTAKFLNTYEFPIVQIPIQLIDYALAIRTALQQGSQKIAIARHRFSPSIPMVMLQELMGISLQELIFEDAAELHEYITKTTSDTVIGTSLAVDIAFSCGKIGVLLYSRKESIREACLQAEDLVREIHSIRHNREITKAILNNAQLGIIVSDTKGYVQMFNRTAQRYTGIAPVQIHNYMLTDFFPNLSLEPLLKSGQKQMDSYRLINGAMMHCMQERIFLDKRTIGVLTTLYPDSHKRRRTNDADKERGRLLCRWEDVPTEAPAMKKLLENSQQISDLLYPTMILGESGSGREKTAQCLHCASPRVKAPCITIDLATIDDEDAAHILLGYEKKDYIANGMLVNANGGSVILRNLMLAKPTAIACLIHALVSRQIFRPGMDEPLILDIMLYTLMTPKEFRGLSSELKSRFAVFQLVLPPLRERKEDIEPLFLQSLSHLCELPKRMIPRDEITDLLRFYSWPGNLPELHAAAARYAFALMRIEKPTVRTQYLLMMQAIGEDALFHEILECQPVLMQRPILEKDAFLEGILSLKKWMKYSNDIIAEKLSLSRTTIWRLLQDSSVPPSNDK